MENDPLAPHNIPPFMQQNNMNNMNNHNMMNSQAPTYVQFSILFSIYIILLCKFICFLIAYCKLIDNHNL